MCLILILAIGFYLYQTGNLQKLLSNFQSKDNDSSNKLKQVIDYKYASGEISFEEYNKFKAML